MIIFTAHHRNAAQEAEEVDGEKEREEEGKRRGGGWGEKGSLIEKNVSCVMPPSLSLPRHLRHLLSSLHPRYPKCPLSGITFGYRAV